MSHARATRAISYCACIGIVTACKFSLPEPPLVRHPRSAFEEVPYPPPAALPEVVPDRPKGCECVWVEGSWRFRNKSFAWRKGGWFIPPEGVQYARAEVFFASDGRVMYAPGTWYDAEGLAVDRNVRPVLAAVRPRNEFTSEAETAR